MNNDWVPLKLPDSLCDMVDSWQEYEGPSVGWCLVCNSSIESEANMIEGTNDHMCK